MLYLRKYKNLILGELVMEDKKEEYEKLALEIVFLNEQDVLTQSNESGYGDGWIQDPFTER